MIPKARPTWHKSGQAAHLVLSGQTFRTAGPVALVVGTILSAVNEAADILAGTVTCVVLIRIAVNYLVPYVVASIGFLMACRGVAQ